MKIQKVGTSYMFTNEFTTDEKIDEIVEKINEIIDVMEENDE